MIFWEGYISDEVMGTLAPIVVYWLYAGFYHLLPPLDRFRLHSRHDQLKNVVSFPTVVKGVLLQQTIQALVALSMFQLCVSGLCKSSGFTVMIFSLLVFPR